MKGQRNWTIAIRPPGDEQLRKITRIVGLNGAGFSVLTPYHKAKTGFLFKAPVELSRHGPYRIPFANASAFTAEDRVKLSYHTDGFAQFSGEAAGRITSGIDPATGEPKGLGLFTNPLTTPIWTGPSVGITVWGMDEFEEAKERDHALIFEADEFYYRGCVPEDANACMLSIFAFPVDVVPPVRFREGQALLDIALERASGALFSVMQLKVIRLPRERVFLGACVNAMKANYPVKSGWIFNGPGDHAPGRRGHVLLGIYPREGIATASARPLDRGTTEPDQIPR
jgi:hypothetical protein